MSARCDVTSDRMAMGRDKCTLVKQFSWHVAIKLRSLFNVAIQAVHLINFGQSTGYKFAKPPKTATKTDRSTEVRRNNSCFRIPPQTALFIHITIDCVRPIKMKRIIYSSR